MLKRIVPIAFVGAVFAFFYYGWVERHPKAVEIAAMLGLDEVPDLIGETRKARDDLAQSNSEKIDLLEGIGGE